MVVYATAGLAFLAGGSTLTEGPYRRDLADCARFVHRHAGVDEWGDKQWDQTTWGLAHAAIFFAQLHSKSDPRLQDQIKPAMQRCVRLLVDCQTPRGGWCHGQHDVANALEYRDLAAATILVLFALGEAEREGRRCAPVADDRRRGLQYLLASSDGRGRNRLQPGEGATGRSRSPGETPVR